MLDSVLSWVVLLIAGWYLLWRFLLQAMDKPSMKRTEKDGVSKIYHYM